MKRLRFNDAQGRRILPTRTKRCRPGESDPVTSACCKICQKFRKSKERKPDPVRLIPIEGKNYCPSFIPPLKDGILDLSEATKLLLKACFDGKLDAVRHMVEQWNVDVNTIGVLPPWGPHGNPGPLLMGATPLIVAIINQQEPIVKYLVRKRADLSIYTSPDNSKFAGMTALHIALLSHDDISNERPEGPSERIITFLLEKGADPSALTLEQETTWMCTTDEDATLMLIRSGMRLDQRNPRTDETVLHYWAGMKGGRISVKVVKLLLANGVQTNVKDRNGISPLFKAAIGGSYPNTIVLDYFIDHMSISRQEEIDVLELAGSSLIIPAVCFELTNFQNVELAMEYWRRATRLREEGGESFQKTPLSTITDIEWTTCEDLKEIEKRSNRRVIQGLLVGLRILGAVSPGAVSPHVQHYLDMYTRYSFNLKGNDQRFIGACLKIIEVFQGFGTFDTKTSDLILDIGYRCFDELIELSTRKTDNRLIPAETFLKTLQVMTFLLFDKRAGIIPFKHSNDEHRFMKTLYGIIKIVVQRRSLLTKEMMECLGQLVRLDLRDGEGCNLLLYVCRSDRTDVFPTVKLLLRLGADPNCEDNEGNSPLHCLVKKRWQLFPSLTVSLLLKAGCHVDKVNKAGEVAFKPWQSWAINSMAPHEISGVPTNGVKMSRVPSLQCCSARIVRQNFDEIRNSTWIPKSLERFILWH